jgi:hypothetical protein
LQLTVNNATELIAAITKVSVQVFARIFLYSLLAPRRVESATISNMRLREVLQE